MSRPHYTEEQCIARALESLADSAERIAAVLEQEPKSVCICPPEEIVGRVAWALRADCPTHGDVKPTNRNHETAPLARDD